MARHVVEMHFVCRDDLNVTDLGDGTFETGVWAVSAEAAFSVRTVALHQDKATPSYRQGRVIGRTTQLYQGVLVFSAGEDKDPSSWEDHIKTWDSKKSSSSQNPTTP